ncbi:MAG: type IV toxin-antitoxin system AbiEi family antitoxin domain-containing protein [Candidatus Micrarchaeia archaeon]|jgi:predicted transcriptional regulator of viral defense system
MKYEKEFENYFSKESIFTLNDAKRFMSKLGASEAYAKLFIHNQVKKHRIFALGNGYYTFSNNEAVVGFRFAPFYYGLEYALTIRRLWTQMANPVVITATKAKPGEKEIMGHRIIVRRIAKKMMFGFEYVKYSGLFVPVSDIEKTVIDFAYYRIRLEDEVVRVLLDNADKHKLRVYASKSGVRVRRSIEALVKLQ